MNENNQISQNLLLSIESSCDDSSIALSDIQSYNLIYHRKISQENAHNSYGGVVPEIASRLHCESLPLVLADMKRFLTKDFAKNPPFISTQNPLSAIKAIAITTQPGLSVSLLQGLMMAKTLSCSLNIPIISINHLIGHFYSLFINQQTTTIPMSVLLVSGGHTQILEAHSKEDFRIVATSKDDSFGECFDKVAKMLNLGYPGGAIIEQYAKKYEQIKRESTLDFSDLYAQNSLPMPLKHSKELAFSFSGLKNATRLLIQSFIKSAFVESHTDFTQTNNAKIINDKNILTQPQIAYICALFQDVAIRHICDKLTRYLKHKVECNERVETLGIVGGASSNLALRSAIEKICKKFGVNLMLAKMQFCTDNAAMIGRAGIEEYKNGHFSDVDSSEISPHSDCSYLKKAAL